MTMLKETLPKDSIGKTSHGKQQRRKNNHQKKIIIYTYLWYDATTILSIPAIQSVNIQLLQYDHQLQDILLVKLITSPQGLNSSSEMPGHRRYSKTPLFLLPSRLSQGTEIHTEQIWHQENL